MTPRGTPVAGKRLSAATSDTVECRAIQIPVPAIWLTGGVALTLFSDALPLGRLEFTDCGFTPIHLRTVNGTGTFFRKLAKSLKKMMSKGSRLGFVMPLSRLTHTCSRRPAAVWHYGLLQHELGTRTVNREMSFAEFIWICELSVY